MMQKTAKIKNKMNNHKQKKSEQATNKKCFNPCFLIFGGKMNSSQIVFCITFAKLTYYYLNYRQDKKLFGETCPKIVYNHLMYYMYTSKVIGREKVKAHFFWHKSE